MEEFLYSSAVPKCTLSALSEGHELKLTSQVSSFPAHK